MWEEGIRFWIGQYDLAISTLVAIDNQDRSIGIGRLFVYSC